MRGLVQGRFIQNVAAASLVPPLVAPNIVGLVGCDLDQQRPEAIAVVQLWEPALPRRMAEAGEGTSSSSTARRGRS